MDAPLPAATRDGWRRRLLNRLSRRTSSGRFIPEIDGLRFVSIALVVLYHLGGYVALRGGFPAHGPEAGFLFRIGARGHYGVPIFFVISGFVLGLPFAAQHLAAGRPVRLRPYFVRRLTRLEPPYVLAMLALWPLVSISTGTSLSELLPHLLASLAYLHNIVYAHFSTINSVAWSLEIEVQFYVLAPLLAAAAFRWRNAALRRLGLLAVSAVAIAVQLVLLKEPRIHTLASYIQFFLLGFLVADLYTTRWTRPSTRPGAWDALWLACWPAMWLAWEAPPAVGAFAFPAVVLALFAASLRGRLSRRVLSNPWVVTIGGMCYTIYLLHYPLISVLGRGVAALGVPANATLSLLLHCALVIPPLLAVCAVYFALVERPCMDPAWPARLRAWLTSRLSPRKPAVEPATPAA